MNRLQYTNGLRTGPIARTNRMENAASAMRSGNAFPGVRAIAPMLLRMLDSPRWVLAGAAWALAGWLPGLAGLADAATPTHGLAIYGPQDLKYGTGEPYAFANLDAPKGGTLRLAQLGAFTKLNSYSLKGTAAPGLGMVFESLMEGSLDDDEAFSQYGRLAESVEVADDRMSVTYRLQPAARFSDGRPVTADDVVFSFNLIHDPQFIPFFRTYYQDVREAVKVDDRTVRFEFHQTNQELPLIMGQLTVLPRHVYGVEGKAFGRDFDDVAVGSGPYTVASFDFSKHITFERNPDYWGRDLPLNRGRYNFDRIVYRVFLSDIPAREALKGDLVDAQQINTSRDWALAFNGEFVQKNYLIKRAFPHQRLSGMQCFVLNLRKPLFADRRLRMVLAALLDFEDLNQNHFYGQYVRTRSFWDNHPELTTRGPARGHVRRMLVDLRQRHGKAFVPADAIDRGPYNVGDRLDGTPYPIDERIRAANAQLEAMGWIYDPEEGVRKQNGRPLQFEFLLRSTTWTRLVNAFSENLREVGIRAGYRLVQPAEFVQRVQAHQFDAVVLGFGVSISPGNEQRDYWTSPVADRPGSRNYAGIRNPAIDEAVDWIIAADSRRALVDRVQVLDRLLCANHYVIPHWHVTFDRAVYWNRFRGPPTYVSRVTFLDNLLNWWWYDPDADRRLRQAREENTALPGGSF